MDPRQLTGDWLDDEAGWRAYQAKVECWRVEHGYDKLEILFAQRDAHMARLGRDAA